MEIFFKDPGILTERIPTRYESLEAHWRYVASLAAGDPIYKALAMASFDFGLADPHLTTLEIRQYEAEVIAAGSYSEYLASPIKLANGGNVRFNVDPNTMNYHIARVFYRAGTTQALHNYAPVISSQREMVVYTDDGIYFINGGQMIDLRAGEQKEH